MIWDMVCEEARTSQWKHAALPEHPELAADLLADHAACEAIVDPLTAQPLRAYNTEAKLRS